MVRVKSQSKKSVKRESSSSCQGQHHHNIEPKQSRSKRKKGVKRKIGLASETETVFRLSQEFPNSNWLEEKIKKEQLESKRYCSALKKSNIQ